MHLRPEAAPPVAAPAFPRGGRRLGCSGLPFLGVSPGLGCGRRGGWWRAAPPAPRVCTSEGPASQAPVPPLLRSPAQSWWCCEGRPRLRLREGKRSHESAEVFTVLLQRSSDVDDWAQLCQRRWPAGLQGLRAAGTQSVALSVDLGRRRRAHTSRGQGEPGAP